MVHGDVPPEGGGPLVAGKAALTASGASEAAPESKEKRNVDKPVVSDGGPTYPLGQGENGPLQTSGGFLYPVSGTAGHAQFQG